MDKNRVDRMIPVAYEQIKECGLLNNDGTLQNSYRAGVSSFGAAVTMGSFLSAAAFFSAERKQKQESSEDDKGKGRIEKQESGEDERKKEYDKKKLGLVIARTTASEIKQDVDVDSLYCFVKGHEDRKDVVLDAAIAVKLAMNLYTLVK